MPTLTVEINDATKELVDREVAAGRFKDASALVEMLVTRFLWQRDRNDAGGFSKDEKERIDQMLDEAMDSYERGEYSVVRPNEFEELAARLVEQMSKKQAS